MNMSRMDTGSSGSSSVVSAKSCFLVAPEIPGDFDVGAKVKKGHPVSEWGVGLSRAILPNAGGLSLESARAVGSPMTITLSKTGHLPEFLNVVNDGRTIPKLDIYVLKSHGGDDATADVVLQITLTNVRFQRGQINVKRQSGGYTTGSTDQSRTNEPGSAADADPNVLAQTEDPNNVASIEDVFIIEVTYDTISGVWAKIGVAGETKGNITFYYNFVKNSTAAA